MLLQEIANLINQCTLYKVSQYYKELMLSNGLNTTPSLDQGSSFSPERKSHPLNSINQPMIPAGYYQPQALPNYEQFINDPHFKLEQELKCSRITIMVFSIITYVLFVTAGIFPFTSFSRGIFQTFYPMMELIPHLFLAVEAHSRVSKPIDEQLRNQESRTCSLISFIFFTIVPVAAIIVTISLYYVIDACESGCRIYFMCVYFFGILPMLTWIPLWFLPFSYFNYMSKLQVAKKNQILRQHPQSGQVQGEKI
ncbi:hypothetical protein FGO68_gene4477 [Halteria grandinella]|uniref:Uncharacterized protein n=1 Tax=Halteria grandinella TaxID=5974 RepID=A0A8J8NJG8_HALGN|nr:hypothetical protein FGO68_gene4477 [Halteria grandinella]